MDKNMNERAVNNNFGATLKYWREKRGLSLQDLNDRTGISNSYISRLEQGNRKCPSLPILDILAKALDIQLSLLLNIATNEVNQETAPLVSELILYNDCKIDTEVMMDKAMKQSIIQIIEFIFEMNWEDNNRMKQLFELSELIDDFKEVSQ